MEGHRELLRHRRRRRDKPGCRMVLPGSKTRGEGDRRPCGILERSRSNRVVGFWSLVFGLWFLVFGFWTCLHSECLPKAEDQRPKTKTVPNNELFVRNT